MALLIRRICLIAEIFFLGLGALVMMRSYLLPPPAGELQWKMGFAGVVIGTGALLIRYLLHKPQDLHEYEDD